MAITTLDLEARAGVTLAQLTELVAAEGGVVRLGYRPEYHEDGVVLVEGADGWTRSLSEILARSDAGDRSLADLVRESLAETARFAATMRGLA